MSSTTEPDALAGAVAAQRPVARPGDRSSPRGGRPSDRREAPVPGDRDRDRTGTGTALVHVVRAEVIKARSLRSTVIALAVAALLLVLLGPVSAVGVIVQDPPADGLADAPIGSPLGAATSGVSSALYAVLAFGVLAVTGEYATGTVRSTLTAVPRRGLLVVGKAVAVAAVTFASMLAAMVVSFVAARAVLATADIAVPVADPDAVRVVVGAALYLTVVALVGSGFGWLLRSTAGAVSAAVGLLVVLPALAFFLPARIGAAVRPYLPDVAGAAVYTPVPDLIGPWTGFAVFAGYGVVVLAAGALVFSRRDA